ncbi:MAG: glycosyltransferase family 2 protein [Planctomycetes bacterium]|nr:glycosyltransferase family 2 protein [Planctomycetota bacterium]
MSPDPDILPRPPQRTERGTELAPSATTTIEASGARIGVVIPCYRVAPQIEKVIRGIPAWVEAIIVVDDASPDDSAARVTALNHPRVTLLRHPQNQGVGGAMQTGFAEALKRGLDVVVKMDGDDQMDASYLRALVEPLVDGRADVTKCNRYSSLRSLGEMPVVRMIGNAGLTFLVKMASGYWNIFDPANGFVAVRTRVLERFDVQRLPKRYFFESGFLIELGIQRAVVLDVPMTAKYGEEHSSLKPHRVLIEFPPKLLYGFMRRLFWRYFVHDFSAVSVFVLTGFPLLVFGLAFGIYEYAWFYTRGEYASAGVVMLAAMPIILGVQLLLQAIVLDIAAVPKTPLTTAIRREDGTGKAR